MKRGQGTLAIYADDPKVRAQRAGLFLRDVAYRLYADMQLLTDEARANPAKYSAMFNRRAEAGQCVNQPYLGCREFAARFRPVPLVHDEATGFAPGPGEPPALQEWTADLGWMLHDMDFANTASPQPRFFRAQVQRGVMDLSGVELRT